MPPTTIVAERHKGFAGHSFHRQPEIIYGSRSRIDCLDKAIRTSAYPAAGKEHIAFSTPFLNHPTFSTGRCLCSAGRLGHLQLQGSVGVQRHGLQGLADSERAQPGADGAREAAEGAHLREKRGPWSPALAGSWKDRCRRPC